MDTNKPQGPCPRWRRAAASNGRPPPCFPKGFTWRSAGSLPTVLSRSQFSASPESRGRKAAEALQGGRKGGRRKLPGRPQLSSRKEQEKRGCDRQKRKRSSMVSPSTGDARCLPTFLPTPILEMRKQRPRDSSSVGAQNPGFSRPTLLCWTPSAWNRHLHPHSGEGQTNSSKFLEVPMVVRQRT